MRAERRAQLYVPVGLQVQQSAAQDAQETFAFIHTTNRIEIRRGNTVCRSYD